MVELSSFLALENPIFLLQNLIRLVVNHNSINLSTSDLIVSCQFIYVYFKLIFLYVYETKDSVKYLLFFFFEFEDGVGPLSFFCLLFVSLFQGISLVFLILSCLPYMISFIIFLCIKLRVHVIFRHGFWNKQNTPRYELSLYTVRQFLR